MYTKLFEDLLPLLERDVLTLISVLLRQLMRLALLLQLERLRMEPHSLMSCQITMDTTL